MKRYIVCWEDRYEPGERETEYNDLNMAIRWADMVRDDGGYADVWDMLSDEPEPVY